MPERGAPAVARRRRALESVKKVLTAEAIDALVELETRALREPTRITGIMPS
jgi:hypothetical protein